MSGPLLTVFDQDPEPLEQRLATGLHKLGLAMKHQSWMQASERGLSPTQGQILAALSQEGPRTGTELAGSLGVSLPTVSDSARVLVEKGLIIKKPDPRSARASLLELTPRGRTQAAAARAWPEFLATAVGSLSVAEQEVFLTSLTKMIRTLQQAGQIPIQRMCITCAHFRPNIHPGPLRHHCAFVDAPMAGRHLRLDCPDQVPAGAAEAQEHWDQFLTTS